MNDAVLVRGSMRTWDLTLLLVASLVTLLGAGVAALDGQGAVAALLAAVATASALGAIWCRRRRVRLRRWVRDTGSGFVLSDDAGDREVADDQVLSMAVLEKQNYSTGLLQSVTRRFVVWLVTPDTQPEQLEMRNIIKAGAADPLARLIGRLGGRLYDQAKDDLKANRPVLGECWRLERGNLSIKEGDTTVDCRVEDVTAVESVDAQLCVWRRGMDAPFAKVALKSANAYLLGRLLADQLVRHPPPNETPAEGQLGRMIFERRPALSTRVTLVVLAAAFFVSAIIFGWTSLVIVKTVYLGVACLVAGIACVLGVIHCRRATFRCHEHGVHQAWLTGRRTLLYAEVEALRYYSMRQFYHGAYTGTTFRLSFEPVSGRKADRIRYSVTLKNADNELDNLRDRTAQLIAGRMAQRLAAKEAVPWTRKLRFLAEGIEYRAIGFLGRKEPILIRYADMTSFTIKDGTFHLWVKNQKKPAVRETTMARNFFPGFYLLLSKAKPVQV